MNKNNSVCTQSGSNFKMFTFKDSWETIYISVLCINEMWPLTKKYRNAVS